MNIFYFILSLLAGYYFNRSLSKSGYRINRKLPYYKIKFIQFSPNIKIHFKNRYIWIHHWLTYTVILIITLTSNAGILDTLVSKGILVGGILQGLTFSDWKTLIHRRDVSSQ